MRVVSLSQFRAALSLLIRYSPEVRRMAIKENPFYSVHVFLSLSPLPFPFAEKKYERQY